MKLGKATVAEIRGVLMRIFVIEKKNSTCDRVVTIQRQGNWSVREKWVMYMV